MNIVSTQPIPTSPLLNSPVSAVTKHGVRWLWTQIILPHAKIPICLWNGNYLILHGISIFGIDSHCPMLETYAICEAMCMQWRTYDYSGRSFGQCGFNAIAKSSLIQWMHIINPEKTPLKIDVAAAMLLFYLYGIIFAFFVIVFECAHCL